MAIKIFGDYRLAFIKPGQVRGHERVNIDLTPTPSPFSPRPKMAIGKITTSVAELHKNNCPLMNGCGKAYHDKNNGYAECVKSGRHDCTCSRWFKYLRQEIKKGLDK
jgi:hypothetical protein